MVNIIAFSGINHRKTILAVPLRNAVATITHISEFFDQSKAIIRSDSRVRISNHM
jgi:hypothetical protein